MRRRSFLTLVGSAAAAWPLAARAQQGERVRRIGARNYARDSKITMSVIPVEGLSFPQLPAMGDRQIRNIATSVHYLLEVVGKAGGEQLEELYGGHVAALFELGLKSNLAVLLYAPDDSLSVTLRKALERAGQEALLPAPVCTGNLDPSVLVMQPAHKGLRHHASDLLNRPRDRCILAQ